MSEVHVSVRNAAGDSVGSFSNGTEFRRWRKRTQKEWGEHKKLAVAIADKLIVDTPTRVNALPRGTHEAALVQRAPIPAQA